MDGIRIPRKLVQMFLKEIDPAGCERRRQHSIRRRQYVHPGPDCYDKLKPWGFPIHGAIDGYSRKILWLKVARTSNSPDMIGSFYSQTVGRLGGCPVKLITEQRIGWLLRYNASSEIIRKHINMLHHQEINELKVGGPNLQSKEQIGGGIFSKIWFPVTYSIQQMLFK